MSQTARFRVTRRACAVALALLMSSVTNAAENLRSGERQVARTDPEIVHGLGEADEPRVRKGVHRAGGAGATYRSDGQSGQERAPGDECHRRAPEGIQPA